MAFVVKTFIDIIESIAEELKLAQTDTVEMDRLRRDVNMVYNNVASASGARWAWLGRNKQIEFKPYLANGTVSVTPGSTTATFSTAPATSKAGYLFSIENYSEIYVIESHVAGATTFELGTPFTGQLYSGVAYKIWTDSVILPTDCRETQEVYHQFSSQPLEGVGLQEFRRRVALEPKRQGRPELYCTYDYEDPTPEDGESETDRYLVMRVYPSIYQNSTTLNVDYIREVVPLELDTDEPLMPIEDRSVLVFGGLERAWKRFRNTEAGEQSKRDFQEKLGQMQGRVSDSQDTPQITPNSQYLARKRGRIPNRHNTSNSGTGSYTAPTYLKNAIIEGAQVTANISVNPGITIDGVDISALSNEIDDHIADTTGAHAASAISVVPLGSITSTDVQTALQELSSEIDAITEAAGISVVPTGNLDSDNVQDALEELQGDIDDLNAETHVDSLNTLTGAVTLAAGSNITITPSGNTLTLSVSGGGDVTGPAAATDNALARFDSTTGKLIQNSLAILSDGGALSGLTGITSSGTTTLDSGLSGVVHAASGVLSASTIVNADISASAAIASSKLATSGVTAAAYGSSTSIPSITVTAQGIITAASGNAVIAPAGTLTGATLASNVVSSSLISVGTIATGVWNGTAVDVAHGGTGQTSYTDGQLLIGNTTGNTLTKTTLTAGSGVTITNGPGSITVASTSSSPTAPKITEYKTAAATGTHTFTGTPLYVRVRMVGGGGGGSGSGIASGSAGSDGTTTTFGSSFLSAGFGSGATTSASGGGAGGSVTNSSGAVGITVTGGDGSGGVNEGGSPDSISGGSGGSSALGGNGGGSYVTNTGTPGKANTGGGGGGAGMTAGANNFSGGGGGAGAYVDIILSGSILTGLSGSAGYAIGSGGAGGSPGSGGGAGGAGGSGFIEVAEYYQ